jgi:8-hydroxy-5-deazaflavin:NADPH oxidoreductase
MGEIMRIGVLGTGDVGRALATGFATIGDDVMMGSRAAGNPSAMAWAKEQGPRASTGTFAEAARFGEVVVFATKGVANPDVAAAAGIEAFAGKIVIDATNPLDHSKGYPDLAIKGEDSGGETLQRLLRAARVVKAFNIVNNSLMFRPELPGGPPDMLIAGNDAEAKRVVTRILNDFGWPTIDLGGIVSARWLEAMCMAWVMASLARKNWRQAFKLLSD